MDNDTAKSRTIYETIEVAGGQLMDSVKRLLKEGNVRKLRITDEDGDVRVELPVTVGIVAGGVLTLAAPWLAVIGVIAALVTKVKIEVEREAPAAPAEPPAALTGMEPAAKPEPAAQS